MNLIYRGSAYRASEAAVTPARFEVIGRYRGQSCRRAHFDVAVSHPRITLKYRGVAYMPGLSMSERPVGVSDVRPAPVDAVTSLSQHVQSELEKVHTRSIQKNIEHRLKVAREQGNQALIYLLEQEQHQLAS